MKQSLLVIALVLICSFSVFGQSSNYLLNYRNPANSLYWKNKMPHPGYWQQDVHYRIKAEMNDQLNIISGTEELTYYNNSPDTLHEVFFHLYQNAFQPGAYYDKLQRNNKVNIRYGFYESEGYGTTIQKLEANGQEVQAELDNTILRVQLPQPLLPNDSVTFDIEFATFFDIGSVRRRMKMFFNKDGSKHYNGVHWYPRISVYDRKFGWTTDQHLGREFYGDFGTFEVDLTFPSHYIVDGTGVLLNRDELLPEALRQKLDISNFKDKPFGSMPSEIIPVDSGQTKTWRFFANNVHDFGWTADPTYRIAEVEWNDIKAVALAREQNAAGWQGAAEYTSRIIQIFSRDFGLYAWPKIIVADAEDGMEYPMMTLDRGREPSYNSLLVHEVGHMWFFGMLGNNETYRASMDEGFTQFLTVWGLEQLDGNSPAYGRPKWAGKNFENQEFKMARLYGPYLRDAILNRDAVLNTHSDDFGGAIRHGGGYGHVYYKTGTMLYNLQYVLGDDLFQRAMQNYVEQWKIAHPYFEDFRNSVISFTGVDLNWFFDQWWTTNKHIDYAIQSVSRDRSLEKEVKAELPEGENVDTEIYVYRIKLKRKAEMQMPIDLRVTGKSGTEYDFYIPNSWFEKETNAFILPRWIGWGEKLNPEYEAVISMNEKIDDVEIDPSHRMADVYLPDNKKSCNTELQFEKPYNEPPDWEHYSMNWRPDVWYNSVDGIKAGLHLNGGYQNILNKFHLTAWYNTGLLKRDTFETVAHDEWQDQFSFNFKYETQLLSIDPALKLKLGLKHLDGLTGGNIGLERDLHKGRSLSLSINTWLRPDSSDLDYLIYPDEWQPANNNTALSLDYRKNYALTKGNGSVTAGVETSIFTKDYNYYTARAEWQNRFYWQKFWIKNRLFASHSGGTRQPDESMLFLAGASPVDLMDDKYMRSRGFFPDDWLGYGIETNHLHHGGGLNLRGYSGYLAPHADPDTNIFLVYKGFTGAALNLEVEFGNWFPIRPPLLKKFLRMTPYLFADVGVMNYNDIGESLEFAEPRADAGIGAVFSIHNWFNIEKASPLHIRVDFPLFLSHTPAVEENFQFRYVIGVGRAF
ncbi:MAG: M1 family metallopeptidase [Bacteroidia bacterium]